MTKIYLVLAIECNDKGIAIVNNKKVFEVFTNRRLAEKAVEYLNNDWRMAFKTKNFKGIKWYTIQVHFISHEDYSKLSF